MSVTVKVAGLADIERALDDLSQSAARGVGRRVLKAAGQPVADRYSAAVRRRSGDLGDSAAVSDKLTRRQASGRKKAADVEMFIGPGGLPQAITEEFGTVNIAPQGELRNAWDHEADPTLDRIARGMETEVEKSVARARRRAEAKRLRG